ncbi:MAG: tRNA (adenosine(37)-N6)-threonylcarbamoyltransferase complex ATPase subunit type 1 TsaE [Planctomycetales bacterium]|nr:tRNA (adenosine(37)-N6)-threonylcarbamoyltransferase complex ATPase subunit type 1 TsaE [Planctomycetales bacterium]
MKRVVEVASEADTAALAQSFADACEESVLVGLSGTLGAGKTFFVRHFASRFGVEPDIVVSPTFTLCNEYNAARKIYHLDLYRVNDEDEFFELGVEEMCSSGSVVFIEWSDRFLAHLPPNRIDITIEIVNAEQRRFCFESTGHATDSILRSLSSVTDESCD